MQLRHQFPSLGHKQFYFIFHRDWQSSDYTSSNDSPGESDNGGSLRKPVTLLDDKIMILKTCEPDYRSELVHVYCYILCVLTSTAL